MFDVFYTGKAPGLFPHEMEAPNLEFAAKYSKTKYFWFINGYNIYDDFDFYWTPDKWEDHQQHIFPSQWNKNSETYFCNKECMDEPVLNYNRDQVVTRSNWDFTGWHGRTMDMLTDSIDFSWHPDPMEEPFIYHFPTKFQKSSGLTYSVEGAVHHKFVSPFVVEFLPSNKNWDIPKDIDPDSLELTWRPDALDGEWIHDFPTKFQRASGVRYNAPNAINHKYDDSFTVKHRPSKSNWIIPDDIANADLTWRPNPYDPPYIYSFPSEWARESGLEYRVPGSNKYKFIDDITVSFSAEALPRYYIETSLENLIDEHAGEVFWALSKEMNYDNFDFSWHPDNSQRYFVHVFGSQWQKHAETFYVDITSVTEELRYNFVTDQTARADSSTHIFYVDKSNSGSSERYEILRTRCENITRIRFVKDMAATIKRASKKSVGSQFWVISSENDYSNFDFSWKQEPWQNYMFHVFGSEKQKWSDTYLVNKMSFDNHMHDCNDIKKLPDLNFVNDQNVKFIELYKIYEIDFGQHNKREIAQHNTLKMVQHNTLKTVQHNTLKTTRFNDSYLAVIKRIVASETDDYIWVTANICDYTDFDFGWRPDIGEEEYMHVFGTAEQKFGDTFLVHVPTFKEQMGELKLLDWFETVKFHLGGASRIPYDQVPYTGDDLTSVIKAHKFDSPYALFYPAATDPSLVDYHPSVWRLKDRAIHTFTESGSVVLAPRDTLQYLDTQCYDYPEIKRQKVQFIPEKPLDIIYISNGESTADAMYDHLMDITKHDSTLVVKRVDGVDGRAAAYKAAAEISDTDWAFNVFAKLKMNPDFDFHWQPDRLQEPKHYIFHARNAINGLEYGHQACIAYNKKLVLETDEWGLDFTLSKEHEVIPLLSGTAVYGDGWTNWRTAFRECLKLLAAGDDVSMERFHHWCMPQDFPLMNPREEMSILGAKEAHNYFKAVNGDHAKLMLSFEWDWLKKHYETVVPASTRKWCLTL